VAPNKGGATPGAFLWIRNGQIGGRGAPYPLPPGFLGGEEGPLETIRAGGHSPAGEIPDGRKFPSTHLTSTLLFFSFSWGRDRINPVRRWGPNPR